jgi:hypothetical protein
MFSLRADVSPVRRPCQDPRKEAAFRVGICGTPTGAGRLQDPPEPFKGDSVSLEFEQWPELGPYEVFLETPGLAYCDPFDVDPVTFPPREHLEHDEVLGAAREE